MARDLPYFKFIVSEYNDGDITLCSLEAQGLFINLCALYWSQEGNLSITKCKRRFNGCNTTVWDELINDGVIKVSGDAIKISFLDEQFAERRKLSTINKQNVDKRWKKEGVDTVVLPSNNGGSSSVYNIEERREEKKREEKKRDPDDWFLTKADAFKHIRDDELLIADCQMMLSGKGWRTVTAIDVVACLKQFLNGKVDIDTSDKKDVIKHFKNWLFREKNENLQTLAEVFKKSL